MFEFAHGETGIQDMFTARGRIAQRHNKTTRESKCSPIVFVMIVGVGFHADPFFRNAEDGVPYGAYKT